MTDWSATGSMLSGIGTSLGALAVIYAAHKGSDTFKQWRKQKHHERCMAVAEEILTLSYRLKRAFENIRSPGPFWGEEEDAATKKLKAEGESDPSQPLIAAQVALSRIEEHGNLFDAVFDKTPLAKAIFGDAVVEQMNMFSAVRDRIIIAAHSYARESRNCPEGTDAERQQTERLEEELNILWSGGHILWPGGDVDPIAIEIDKAVTQLEGELLPILRNAD